VFGMRHIFDRQKSAAWNIINKIDPVFNQPLTYSSESQIGFDASIASNSYCIISSGAISEIDAGAIRWANSMILINGFSNTLFDPNGVITREQLAVLIYRFAQSSGRDVSSTTESMLEYKDAYAVRAYAREAVAWCVSENILQGSNGELLSFVSANRAEVITMLYRYSCI